MGKIATLFDNDITRQIEEVIKVDQTSADIIASEIDEYVVTDAIKKKRLRNSAAVPGHLREASIRRQRHRTASCCQLCYRSGEIAWRRA